MKQFFSLLFLFVLFFGLSFAQNQPNVDKDANFQVNPKPHEIIFDGDLVPLEEVFGLNQNGFSAGPRSRGNLFTCTTERKIIEHRMYLAPTVATQMWFCIYEGAAQVGTYNLVSSVDVSPQGPGEGWYSSGAIDFDMTPGMYYLIFASFEQPSGYWNENPVAPYPVPASFGTLEAGAGWSYAPTSNFPPDATQDVPATAFGDPVAYYQTIVTEDIGGSTTFTDDFEAYTSGVQLVTQNNVDWDTWSGGPGGGEDPFVSDLYSYSGSNSVVVVSGNDFIRRHGDLTTGTWYMSFNFYIPSGQSGYFNTMNDFDGTFVWGMDSYFDVGGTGRLDTTGGGGGGSTNVDFTYVVDAWNQVIVCVDLDASVAQYWLATNPSNLTLIATWDWTQGGSKPNMLAVNDFFGAAGTDEMYVDDYYFGPTLPAIIPVELTSFTANVNRSGQVELNWSTASETNNQLFEIERRTAEGQFATIGYVEGHGTTSEPQNYSYTDVTVSTGIYFYRLKQLDFLGYYEYFDEIEVDVNGPLTFDLEQNYPNPFNPSTNIKYSVPETGNVRLSVYNLIGEEVAVLVDGFSEAGFYEVTFDASSLASGAYIYKLQSGNSVVAKKMLLMK